MANKVTQIVGFFYQQGSIDFPFNMGVNDKFGFSDVGGTAIFQYSINDVEQTLYIILSSIKQELIPPVRRPA